MQELTWSQKTGAVVSFPLGFWNVSRVWVVSAWGDLWAAHVSEGFGVLQEETCQRVRGRIERADGLDAR